MKYFDIINTITKDGIIEAFPKGTIFTFKERSESYIHILPQHARLLEGIGALDFLNIDGQNESTSDRLYEYPVVSSNIVLESNTPHTGIYKTTDTLTGSYLFELAKLYSNSSVELRADIIALPTEGVIWFVEGNLDLAKYSSINGMADNVKGVAPLHIFVRGNLTVSEFSRITCNDATIVVCGNLSCQGEISIKGQLVVLGIIKGAENIKVSRQELPSFEQYL